MAGKRISELVEVIELNSTDTFPVVSEGETRKANIQQVFDFVNKNLSLFIEIYVLLC